MDLIDYIIFPTAAFLLVLVAGGSFNFPGAVVGLLGLIAGGGLLLWLATS